MSCQVQCFPTANEKKRQSMKRKKSVESDCSDDESAAAAVAAACSSESAAAPAAARSRGAPRLYTETVFLCAHPNCSDKRAGQSGFVSRAGQVEHVREVHGGAFATCEVVPPRKKCKRDEVEAAKAKEAKEAKAVLAQQKAVEKAAKAVEKAEKKRLRDEDPSDFSSKFGRQERENPEDLIIREQGGQVNLFYCILLSHELHIVV